MSKPTPFDVEIALLRKQLTRLIAKRKRFRMSSTIGEKWEDSAFRRKQLANMNSADAIAKRSTTLKAFFKRNPDVAAARSERMKKQWQDPAMRDKMLRGLTEHHKRRRLAWAEVEREYPKCEHGVLTCDICYKCIGEVVTNELKCPHGLLPGNCNACDIAADFAYDAAREARTFR